jgi:hypothetical protein
MKVLGVVIESRFTFSSTLHNLSLGDVFKKAQTCRNVYVLSALTMIMPLIGPNGVIEMEINQLIQKISRNVEIDKNNQPIITKRRTVSFMNVHNRYIVILAGLQER